MSNKIDPPQPNHPLTAVRRTGVVDNTTNAPATIQVWIGNDGTDTTIVSVPLPYVGPLPYAGDTVLCLFVGGDGVVIGSLTNPNDIVPYAMATGVVTSAGTSVVQSGHADTAITFPTGRFSQAPRVTATFQADTSNTAGLTNRIVSVTTSGCTLRVTNNAGVTETWTGLVTAWLAVQMTAASADG